ncbi:MAG: methylated-DNA--[protein]-cysteine S-methyltransferase [Anaerorhabdus sp.]
MKKRKISTPFGLYLITEENQQIVEICHSSYKEMGSDKSLVLLLAERELMEYFNGKRKKFSLPISFQGTSFQKKVWNELMKIPYGEVRSYKEIATLIGHPKAYRAVGSACNKNPIGVVVPCHRVVAANKKLGGFAYGADEKINLLKLEGYEI